MRRCSRPKNRSSGCRCRMRRSAGRRCTPGWRKQSDLGEYLCGDTAIGAGRDLVDEIERRDAQSRGAVAVKLDRGRRGGDAEVDRLAGSCAASCGGGGGAAAAAPQADRRPAALAAATTVRNSRREIFFHNESPFFSVRRSVFCKQAFLRDRSVRATCFVLVQLLY